MMRQKTSFPNFISESSRPSPLIAISIFYAEARKKEALEYRQQPLHAVTLACEGKCIALGHFDLKERTELMFFMAAVMS